MVNISIGYCNGLNVCVPLSIINGNPNPQCDGVGGGSFGRSLGDKGGALVCGICALIKEAQRALSLPFCPIRIQQEVCSPKEGPHQNPTVWRPDPGLPASSTLRNKHHCLQATREMVLLV